VGKVEVLRILLRGAKGRYRDLPAFHVVSINRPFIFPRNFPRNFGCLGRCGRPFRAVCPNVPRSNRYISGHLPPWSEAEVAAAIHVAACRPEINAQKTLSLVVARSPGIAGSNGDIGPETYTDAARFG